MERARWTLPRSSASVGPGGPAVGWCAGAMLPLLALNETLRKEWHIFLSCLWRLLPFLTSPSSSGLGTQQAC